MPAMLFRGAREACVPMGRSYGKRILCLTPDCGPY